MLADEHDFADLLSDALAAGRLRQVADEMAPSIAQYRSLREALARYRALAADPQPPLPALERPPRPGDTGPALMVLHQRLVALGDLPPHATPPAEPLLRYEGALIVARRHAKTKRLRKQSARVQVTQIGQHRRREALPATTWPGCRRCHRPGDADRTAGAARLACAPDRARDGRAHGTPTVTLAGYTVRMLGVSEQPGPNHIAQCGEVELSKGGRVLRTLNPEKRAYFSSQMPMTESAIDSGLTRDIYVSLGERLDGAAWSVRVYYKPFVTWIWGGALLMALGGGLATADRRYRLKKREAVTQGVPA